MQLVKLEQTINNRKRFNRSNIYCYPTELLSPSWKKEKKIHYKKNSLYFGKWNFMALILKNFLYFLYISGNGNMENPHLKSFFYFGKQNFLTPSLQNSYISGKIFQVPKIKNFLYYFSYITLILLYFYVLIIIKYFFSFFNMFFYIQPA